MTIHMSVCLRGHLRWKTLWHPTRTIQARIWRDRHGIPVNIGACVKSGGQTLGYVSVKGTGTVACVAIRSARIMNPNNSRAMS